jgi:phosphocarrier protein HPr
MIRRTVTVTLDNGLHMVPASEIAKAVRDFTGKVVIRRDQIIADARSVLDLLQLKAECGTLLEVEAEGDGAAQVVEAIARLFALNFMAERNVSASDGGTDRS